MYNADIEQIRIQNGLDAYMFVRFLRSKSVSCPPHTPALTPDSDGENPAADLGDQLGRALARHKRRDVCRRTHGSRPVHVWQRRARSV